VPAEPGWSPSVSLRGRVEVVISEPVTGEGSRAKLNSRRGDVRGPPIVAASSPWSRSDRPISHRRRSVVSTASSKQVMLSPPSADWYVRRKTTAWFDRPGKRHPEQAHGPEEFAVNTGADQRTLARRDGRLSESRRSAERRSCSSVPDGSRSYVQTLGAGKNGVPRRAGHGLAMVALRAPRSSPTPAGSCRSGGMTVFSKRPVRTTPRRFQRRRPPSCHASKLPCHQRPGVAYT